MTDAARPDERTVLRLRRLHALTGVVPLGAFLVEHVVVNAAALGGQSRFERLTGVTRQSVVFAVLEIVLVLAPLGYHALYGAIVSLRLRPDAARDPLRSMRLAVLMRVSGIVTLVFIAAHLWEYRIKEAFFGLAPTSVYTLLTERMSSTWAGIPWIALAYVVGVAATSFHFAYGLVGVREILGKPESDAGRRRMVTGSIVLGGAVFLVGTATVIALATGTRLLPQDDVGNTLSCGPSAEPFPATSSVPSPSSSSSASP